MAGMVLSLVPDIVGVAFVDSRDRNNLLCQVLAGALSCHVQHVQAQAYTGKSLP
jgi:hypothetical protein